MIVSIYLLFTVLSFIRTVFLHVRNMLFGLMTTRLNKRCYYYYYGADLRSGHLCSARRSRPLPYGPRSLW